MQKKTLSSNGVGRIFYLQYLKKQAFAFQLNFRFLS